jgi:RND superfamily putative drug exporter
MMDTSPVSGLQQPADRGAVRLQLLDLLGGFLHTQAIATAAKLGVADILGEEALRAIVAPLMLIGTVILSYLAALGIGAFFFENVFDFPGMGPDLPLFAFVFLVALGIDYNIFLMARVREETLMHGTRNGMIRGLAVTGTVITSAGLVLAGTFSTLAVLPLVFLTEIGFVIAVGILIDTFLVRSLLVPALMLEIGDEIWWPSALARLAGRDRTVRAPGRVAVENKS